MVGDYVLTESDVRNKNTKYDSIGMGSYAIDSHNVQRYLNQEGYVINEGEIQLFVSPYEIPYRVMLTKESEAQNLLVTICISATHVVYSSVRMEPQYMIMGEAAGIAWGQARIITHLELGNYSSLTPCLFIVPTVFFIIYKCI